MISNRNQGEVMFFAAQNTYAAETINMHNALNKKKSNTSYLKLGRSFQRSERSSDKPSNEFHFNKK